MPLFEFQTKDGRSFQIEAPDRNAATQSWQQSQFAKPTGYKSGAVEDYGKAIGSGLVEGTEATAGFVGDMQSLLQSVGGWAGDKARQAMGKAPLTPEQEAAWRSGTKLPIPTTADVAEFQRGITGFEPYEPERAGARYAKTAASFVPAAVGFGAPGGARAALYSGIKYGVVPGLTSEAGGDVAAAAYGEKARPYGKFAGAVAGPFVAQGAKRLVTPFPASASRTQASRYLQNEGVTNLTAGQRTGNKRLQFKESQAGGARIAQLKEGAGEQFTAAALRRAGINNANRATPEVLNQAFDDIGQQFNGLAARNQVIANRQLATDLGNAVRPYMGAVGPPNRAPIITNYLDEIANSVQGNAIPGTTYQSLRSRIMADARSIRDPDTANALRAIGGALDDAMERTIAQINPQDLGAYRDARRLYRNLLIVDKAAAGAGEQAASGIITPARLRFGETAIGGYKARTRGRSEFNELARSGEIAMTPLPDSGTPSRLRAMGIPSATSAAGGYTGYALSGGDIPATMLGTFLGNQIPEVLTGGMLSRPGRDLLSNQLMANTVVDPRAAAYATALNATMPARKPLELTVPVSVPPALPYGR